MSTAGRGATRVNTNVEGRFSPPTITTLKDSGWLVTWAGPDDSGTGVYQQRYGANGQKIGGERLVNTFQENDEQSAVVTSLSDGGWIITWIGEDRSIYGVFQQRYNASGQAIGLENRVNTNIDGNQIDVSVTGLSDGGWLVTWTSETNNGMSDAEIYQQRYNAAGVKVGGETLVNTNTQDLQTDSAVTALVDGGWVVTWTSYDQDGSITNISQQRFNSAGQKVGGETRVNTLIAGEQYFSSVTTLADGGWLVVWDPSDGGSGIAQQRYNAAGQKVGGETLVNTSTTGDHVSPSVTTLVDGGWIVTWVSLTENTPANSQGIYQQRYNSAGQKIGGEVRIDSGDAIDGYAPSVTALANGGWIVTWYIPTGGGDEPHNIYQQIYSAAGEPIGTTTPTGINLSNLSVSEGAKVASPAGQITAKALDASGGHSFTLLDDAGGRFSLSSSGALMVNNGVKLDYEQANSHQVKVQVRDAYGVSFEQWVTINVADVRSENLTATSGADVLKGGRYADTFKGQGGNDKLYGGLGNDKLYGGAGRDAFVFDTRPNKRTNADKVYDFKSRDDSFYLDNKYFTKLGSGSEARPKKFKSDMFIEGKKAQDREDRIVYDKKTGSLYYDQDGTGSKAQVKIATITNKTKLYWHDFFVI